MGKLVVTVQASGTAINGTGVLASVPLTVAGRLWFLGLAGRVDLQSYCEWKLVQPCNGGYSACVAKKQVPHRDANRMESVWCMNFMEM
jgi:hypothetical protein